MVFRYDHDYRYVIAAKETEQFLFRMLNLFHVSVVPHLSSSLSISKVTLRIILRSSLIRCLEGVLMPQSLAYPALSFLALSVSSWYISMYFSSSSASVRSLLKNSISAIRFPPMIPLSNLFPEMSTLFFFGLYPAKPVKPPCLTVYPKFLYHNHRFLKKKFHYDFYARYDI